MEITFRPAARPGYLLPAGESPSARVRQLIFNARMGGLNTSFHPEVEKGLLEMLRPINPDCKKNSTVARRLTRYLENKSRGLDVYALDELVTKSLNELSVLEIIKPYLRAELAGIWQGASGHLLTEDLVRLNAREFIGKYSIHIFDLLFGRSCLDYARSDEFMDFAMKQPLPERNAEPRPVASAPDIKRPRPGFVAPASLDRPEADLRSVLRETIFREYKQEIVRRCQPEQPSLPKGKFLAGVYRLVENGEAEVKEGWLVKARELVCDLMKDDQIERLGFQLDWLAGTGMDIKDLLVEAFSIFGLTRRDIDRRQAAEPVIKHDQSRLDLTLIRLGRPELPSVVLDFLRSRLLRNSRKGLPRPVIAPDPAVVGFLRSLLREKIFRNHAAGNSLRRVFGKLAADKPVKSDELAKAKDLIGGLRSHEVEKLGFSHHWLDGIGLTVYGLLADSFSLFGVTRGDLGRRQRNQNGLKTA